MKELENKKRIVIKVGSSTLAYYTGHLNIRKCQHLIEVMSDIKNSGREVIFVTSGAQGVGAAQAGLPCKPTDMPGKQACAAIGQSELMTFYSETFGKFNHTVAQLLLTRDVISNKERKTNVINTFNRLFEMGVIPIINANDAISIKQLDFDENDTLSAIVASLCDADLLIMLTDVDGLYDGDPKNPDSKLIPVVEKITRPGRRKRAWNRWNANQDRGGADSHRSRNRHRDNRKPESGYALRAFRGRTGMYIFQGDKIMRGILWNTLNSLA